MKGSRLVLCRHARPLMDASYSDATRPLADEGREIQLQTLSFLEKQAWSPALIYSSPLLRAQQTAEIIAEGLKVPVVTEVALGADPDFRRLLSLVEQGETTLFVGHEPTFGQLANLLLGESRFPNGVSKSSAVVLFFPGKIGSGEAALEEYFQAE